MLCLTISGGRASHLSLPSPVHSRGQPGPALVGEASESLSVLGTEGPALILRADTEHWSAEPPMTVRVALGRHTRPVTHQVLCRTGLHLWGLMCLQAENVRIAFTRPAGVGELLRGVGKPTRLKR